MTTLRFLKPSRFPRIRAHPLPLALLTALAVGGRALGKMVLPAPGSSPRRGVSEDWGGGESSGGGSDRSIPVSELENCAAAVVKATRIWTLRAKHWPSPDLPSHLCSYPSPGTPNAPQRQPRL